MKPQTRFEVQILVAGLVDFITRKGGLVSAEKDLKFHVQEKSFNFDKAWPDFEIQFTYLHTERAVPPMTDPESWPDNEYGDRIVTWNPADTLQSLVDDIEAALQEIDEVQITKPMY